MMHTMNDTCAARLDCPHHPNAKRITIRTPRRGAGLSAIAGLSALLLLLFLNPNARSASPDEAAAAFVARMPMASTAELETAVAGLIREGPEAVSAVCGRLAPAGAGSDAPARFAVHALAIQAARPGADAERGVVARALLQALEQNRDRGVRSFLLAQLAWVAQEENAAAMIPFLKDPDLADPAARVLLTIRAPSACPAALEALANAKGTHRLSLIQVLGQMRCTNAALALADLASNPDPATRLAAAHALAEIAVAPAGRTLRAALEGAATVRERDELAAASLHYAGRLADSGQPLRAARLCREAIDRWTAPDQSHLRCAALSTLADAAGADAMPALLAAMSSEDSAFRRTAVGLARRFSGSDATAAWASLLPGASTAAQREILAMLGERGDSTALPAVFSRLKEGSDEVRPSAIEAALRLGGAAQLKPILDLRPEPGAGEIRAIVDGLRLLPAGRVTSAVADQLPRARPELRVGLIEILGARHAREQAGLLLAQAEDADRGVRLAARKALATTASMDHLPALADMVAKDTDADLRAAAQQAVIAVARSGSDPDTAAGPIRLQVLQTADAQRIALMECLAGVGGPRNAHLVAMHLRPDDAAMQDAAVRILADWSDASAAPALLEVISGDHPPRLQALALRGLLRIADLETVTEAQRLEWMRAALSRLARPEDQKTVLAALAELRTVASARLVADHLGRPEVQNEAAQALVRIVCPRNARDQGLRDPSLVGPLRQALALPGMAEPMRRQIEAHLKRME